MNNANNQIKPQWQNDLDKILEKGCTDSDIMDYIDENPNINTRDIWDYTYESMAPTECKGCDYIQYSGMYPCNNCSRRVKPKDHYTPRKKREKS